MKNRSVCTRVVALLLVVMFAFAGCRSQDPSGMSQPVQTTTDPLRTTLEPSQIATEPTTVVAEVPQEIVDALSKFHQHLQDGTLRLTIYYDGFLDVIYESQITPEDLMSFSYVDIITVENDELQRHSEGFAEFQADILIPAEEDGYQSTHMCYIFESPDEGVFLTVASNLGWSSTYFINGFEVQYNVIFYDMIRPFLTEEITTEIDPVYYWQPG